MREKKTEGLKSVYVVEGRRTPFLKAKGPGPFSASDLAVLAGRSLLMDQPIKASDLDEVILGAAMPGPDEANIARIVALRLGAGDQVPGFTVMRNCASGLQAIDTAAMHIATGRSHLVLAGGTEAMSHAPILLNQHMATWLSKWMSAKTFTQKAQLITQLRPSYFSPVIALLRGLTDPVIGMNMGQTAEQLAYRFQITREEMDAFASESHQRAARAYKEGIFASEVVPIIDAKGRTFIEDDGIRDDSTPEKLATLKPFFDKKYGMVTAGNSSQITDGACVLLLASEDAVKRFKLNVIGRIVDTHWAALNPAEMGLGPVHAATPLLLKHHLTPKEIACWEINEAFAAQVLACLRAWDDERYCKTVLGLEHAFGAPEPTTINRHGGAIALGHPIGASGARIVLHVLESLKQEPEGAKGVAAICIGGGQGGAMYLERTSGVKHESL